MILHDRGLATVGIPVVRRSVLPSIQARLVAEVVIAPPQHQSIFHPDEALADFQSDIAASAAEIETFGICVEDVERRAGKKHINGALEGVDQEFPEFAVFHVVVDDALPQFAMDIGIREVRLGGIVNYPDGNWTNADRPAHVRHVGRLHAGEEVSDT